jgi:hypothetical protein
VLKIVREMGVGVLSQVDVRTQSPFASFDWGERKEVTKTFAGHTGLGASRCTFGLTRRACGLRVSAAWYPSTWRHRLPSRRRRPRPWRARLAHAQPTPCVAPHSQNCATSSVRSLPGWNRELCAFPFQAALALFRCTAVES